MNKINNNNNESDIDLSERGNYEGIKSKWMNGNHNQKKGNNNNNLSENEIRKNINENGDISETKEMDDKEFDAWVNEVLEVRTKSQIPEWKTKEELQKMLPSAWFALVPYTGTLHPSYVTKQMKIPKSIPQPDYANHPDGIPLSEIESK